MSGVNPKNLVLNATAAMTIAQAGLSGAQQAVRPRRSHRRRQHRGGGSVVVYFAMGKRSAHVLGEWKAWLEANNATVTVRGPLVFGFVLIGQGIGGL